MSAMECYCDYDPADIYRAETRRARKRHKCDECSGYVEIGEQYENVFGVWEGYASTFKTCQRCFDIRQWVKNNVPCFCWAHGSMLDDAAETVQEAAHRAPSETIGLRFGFLRRKSMARQFVREHKAN